MKKTGGEPEDLGFAVENFCCWFTLFSGYSLGHLGDISFLFVINRI